MKGETMATNIQYVIVRRRSILAENGFQAMSRIGKKAATANVIGWDRREDAEAHIFANLPALKDCQVFELVLGKGVEVQRERAPY